MKRRSTRGDATTEPYSNDDAVTVSRAAPAFTHKGIGANLFLTAAAAAVPMLILSVAGLTRFKDRRAKGISRAKPLLPKRGGK